MKFKLITNVLTITVIIVSLQLILTPAGLCQDATYQIKGTIFDKLSNKAIPGVSVQHQRTGKGAIST